METSKKKRTGQTFGQFKILLIFLLLCVVLAIMAPSFLTGSNLINVLRQISIISIISMGSTMVVVSGGIDLSPGAVVAAAGVAAAMLATTDAGMPVIVPILAGIGVGVLCGLINGVVVAKGNVPPFIVTMGMSSVARGFAYVLSEGKPISSLSDSFQVIGRSSLAGIPVPILIMLVMLAFTAVLMSKFTFGKHVYATGGNPVAARVSGINVDRITILVYTFAGAMAGLGGLVLASRINTGHPNSGTNYELDAIAATVIGGTSLSGGKGNVLGTIVGALIIGVLNNGLDILGVPAYYQQICKGVIIVATVLMDQKSNQGR